jgi:exportin-T
MTPQEVEQYVLLASDASNLQHQQQANSLLLHWVYSSSDNLLADTLLQALRLTQREVVLFYCLTTFHRLHKTTMEQRAVFRQEILTQLLNDKTSFWRPTYLRTKVGVLLTKFVQLDFPHAWPNAFQDLQSPKLLQGAPDIFLRTLVALAEEFGKDETKVNSKMKDLMRGYSPDQQQAPTISPRQSISGQLLKTILPLLTQALEENNGNMQYALQIAVLCLTVIKGFMSWVDLSLLLDEQTLNLLFTALAKAGTRDSPVADAGVSVMECLQELVARGMEDEKKIAMLARTNALELIHAHINLEVVDASPIDVVLEVAKFINRTGLEILPILSGQKDNTLYPQLLDLFFRCFAYDDIDVSGAVIPLAGSLVSSKKDEQQDAVFSQLLTVTYRQMRYPADFQYDYEDEDEAEEEMYRTELRKLNQKFIRSAPEVCLQSLVQSLSQLQLPLSSAPTPDIEAALRLVYHYCEGIRPPPGLKVVMRNTNFRNLLVGLHTSDITSHPHQEVLILYYDTAVRYYPLLKDQSELLQKVLEALTGNRGVQNMHPRVRFRCCYLLLRLIKSVGNSNATNSVLRPYVETAVAGIQGLLENSATHLRVEDTLNLFETIGLLLGKTGLESHEQKTYLTQVMTPHVRSIEQMLEQKQALEQDPETNGEILAGSIAAIASLSKGFKKPPYEIQIVLLEALKINRAVLEALPNNTQVRNKSFVLMQRLIQCLGEKVLPSMPQILYLFITHCTTEDILDVSQLFNQLCIKFKTKAISAIDAALLPFLQKCHALVTMSNTTVSSLGDAVAPHQCTEQLSIQKLTYTVLQHTVAYGVEGVLLTPTNVPSLESILKSMRDGAVHVEDPIMKKTCLIFFKDLLSQWVSSVGNGKGQTDGSSPASAPPYVLQGYVHFLTDVLIPEVMISFWKEAFNCEDANQWRSVSEVAGIFEILHERLPDAFYQEVLVGKLTTSFGCPPSLVEGFRVASNRKDTETCLKNLIKYGNNKALMNRK